MSIMNFAEEPVPTPPVNPADTTPAEPAIPAESAEPTEPTKPTEPTTPVEPTEPATPAESEDPNKVKIDALQNSLDAALEELSKENEPGPVEPTPVESAPAKPAESVEPVKPIEPVEPIKPVESPKEDEVWKQEVDAVKKNQEEFQSTTLKELEQMKLKDEMIGLTSEVQAAIMQYPNADSDKILLEVESGSDETVTQIAKDLHDEHQTLVDKITKEQEEKIKTALDKENEGGIKVPQSSGTSSAPTETPNSTAPVTTKASQDAAWATATREAKANLL